MNYLTLSPKAMQRLFVLVAIAAIVTIIIVLAADTANAGTIAGAKSKTKIT